MIGFFLKIAVLLVVGVLSYNYFFGTPEEQAHSSKTFTQIKEIAVSVGELARAEKDKFDAGKYDGALDKLGAAYKTVREGAQKLDAGLLKQVDELEARRAALKHELDAIQSAEADAKQAGSADQARRKQELLREMEDLVRDSDTLLSQINQQ